jgi:peptide/nickel transport system substrate-binding protein
VITWGSAPWSSAWAELLQAQLTQIGADIQLQQMTDAAVGEAIDANEINMAATAWSSSDPVVLSTVFHSRNIDGGNAMSHYASPELDALLETGEESIDDAVRAEAYGEAQMLIMEQGLIIPVTLWSQPVAAQASVTDLKRDFRNYMWLYDTYVAP